MGPQPENYGATRAEWNHFDLILGLTEDLLPVVSNPTATISPASKMKGLGKTPSRYNKAGHVAGIADWTSHRADSADIEKWSTVPDYGICIQTRTVRAIDVDIEDPAKAAEVRDAVLGHLDLPIRHRADSAKCLLAFNMPGDFPKRVIKTAHGIIEFLATGQQFIAAGTHPSGARYEWSDGLPDDIPPVTPHQFEALWSALQMKFGTEPAHDNTSSVKQAKLSAAAENDPVAVALADKGLVLSAEKDGRLHITCPFEEEHTSDSAESATTYWPAHTGGYQQGHFKCLHAHCEERTDYEFLNTLGLAPDMADDYEAIVPNTGTIVPNSGTSDRYTFVGDSAFSSGPPPGWFVKGVLPKAELGVIYGPPASGKSFFTLDLGMAVARGVPWCGRRVNPGRVGYIVAEGAGGFKNRLNAFRTHNDLPEGDVIQVLAAVPNLLTKQDVVDLGNSIRKMGGLEILIYDTLARGTTGGDENSAQDMGLAIANCRVLHDVTGAMVLLIHHSGKDASRGARGSNAVLGAVDVEIEISRDDVYRTATVSKLKDGEDGTRFGFKLAVVQVGEDEDGDPVTSCVVEFGEARVSTGGKKAKGANERTVLRVLGEMVGLDGSGPGVEALIDRCVDETSFDPGLGKRDQRRRHLNRALDSLKDAEEVVISAGFVTLPGVLELANGSK